MSVGRWSRETYRLDEITNKFSLPCVICFSEGYMDATESESISKDDIIKVDKRVILQKVAADFVNDFQESDNIAEPVSQSDDPYVELRVGEILIPLNYNGTVKVCHNQQVCYGVKHLQRLFPRYAKVLSNIVVTTDDGKQITIQAGSFIELDRTIPGSKSGPDHLVIISKFNGQDVAVTIPVTNQGKFKTLPDENQYTLKQVIERYGFPVVVTFIDDEIKRIYTLDIEEGIDNMKLISATLKLKRLEQQDAIIGHYKPLEENQAQKVDTEYFARRSLVVLPLDNSDIREIQVHILLDSNEEVYDEIFLVSNKSHELNQVLDGTLYVDFSKKSGPRHINAAKKKKQKAPLAKGKQAFVMVMWVGASCSVLTFSQKVFSSETSVKQDQACPPRPPKSLAYHQAVKNSLLSRTIENNSAQKGDQTTLVYDDVEETALVYDDVEGTPLVYDEVEINKINTSVTYCQTQWQKGVLYEDAECKTTFENTMENYENASVVTTEKGLAYTDDLKPKQKKDIKQPQSKSRLPKPEPPPDYEDYEEVSPPPLNKQPSYSGLPSTLADMDFNKYVGIEVKEEKVSALQKLKKKVIGGKVGKDGKQNYYHTSKLPFPFLNKEKSVLKEEESEEDGLPVYDYPDANEITELSARAKRSVSFSEKGKDSKSKKPVALISPNSASAGQQKVKSFSLLTKVELEQRLIQCGMAKFAAVCREKGLDGKFFDTISNYVLQREPFNLSPFDLVKLDRVKQNWVPS